MPYTGKTLQARDACALIQPHFPNSKVKALATMSGESSFNIGAWHDNEAVITEIAEDTVVANVETYELVTVLDPKKGKIQLSDDSVVTVPTTTEWITTRDCGLYQINIPARLIHSDTELRLRTSSADPEQYLDAAKVNISAAYQLYQSPWTRNGKQDIRRWQPWVAYTSGWAMFPEAWVWKHVQGEPVGPWVATGRHLHKAIRGVANWHLLIAKHMNADEALAEAKRLQGVYGAKGELFYDEKQNVYWKYPAQPKSPPSDGVGPRPTPNDGL